MTIHDTRSACLPIAAVLALTLPLAVTAAEPARRTEFLNSPQALAADLPFSQAVRHGDTLWSISQRYNVDVDDLCRWNRIKSPNRYKLVAGKRLVVYPDRDRG